MNTLPQAPAGEFVLFQSEDGRTRVECRFELDTLWLSQGAMAELYGKDVRTINEHLGNIYADGELTQNTTIRKFRIVRREGNPQKVVAILNQLVTDSQTTKMM